MLGWAGVSGQNHRPNRRDYLRPMATVLPTPGGPGYVGAAEESGKTPASRLKGEDARRLVAELGGFKYAGSRRKLGQAHPRANLRGWVMAG